MRPRSASLGALVALLAVVLGTPVAHAIVNQSDGTIIPVGAGLQSCLDKSPTFNAATNPAPGEGTTVTIVLGDRLV